ncbi:hypothetical protein [Paenibacillus sp. BK720]|uniref:hypothetical protein n=1 Tax=Paenibacillus sp. BK720 TaxID=2587092 RepID=UPI001ABB5E60|nr:hypothetical protein [Paenibacillus sp. BK720]
MTLTFTNHALLSTELTNNSPIIVDKPVEKVDIYPESTTFVLSGLFLRLRPANHSAKKLRETAARFSVKTLSDSGKVKLLDHVPASRYSGLNGGELQ